MAAVTATRPSALLIVKIISSGADMSFTLPGALVEQREVEMQRAAKKFGIPGERWGGSLLYRQWKEDGRTAIELEPEKECAVQNYSHMLRWQPWLTALLQSFYRTGKLQVSSKCQGLDLLLMLEFFGIIYEPSQLSFDSADAYQRVKVWSDYLTVRAGISDWVAEAMMAQEQAQYYFATTMSMERMEFGQKPLTIFDGGLGASGKSKSSCVVLFELFNRAEPAGVAASMREDFCVYLQNILTNVHVSFPVKPVTVHVDELSMEQKKRAILMINVVDTMEPALLLGEDAVRTKSDLTYPVDELVEEDLANGKLESLMQQIDARHPSSYKAQSNAYTAQFLTMFEATQAPSRPVVENPTSRKKKAQPATPSSKTKQSEKVPQVAKAAVKPQQQESPRTVAAVDHIYAELEHAEPTANDLAEANLPQEATASTPQAGFVGEGSLAPVNVIHAAERNDLYSVTSALTSPNFADDDGELREFLEGDVRAQALRQEWIQGSVMNRDIFQRVQDLLKEESERVRSERESPRRRNREATKESFESWDWLMDLCQAVVPKSDDPQAHSPLRRVAGAKSFGEASNLLAGGMCSSPPFEDPTPDDAPFDEKKDKSVLEERPNLSAATYRGLVKERLAQVQSHSDVQSRQDSLNKPPRTLGSADRQDCGEAEAEEEVSEGIEVCHIPRPSKMQPSGPSSPERSASHTSATSPNETLSSDSSPEDAGSTDVPKKNLLTFPDTVNRSKGPVSSPPKKSTSAPSKPSKKKAVATPSKKSLSGKSSKKAVRTPTKNTKHSMAGAATISPSAVSATQSTRTNKKRIDSSENQRAGLKGLFRRKKV